MPSSESHRSTDRWARRPLAVLLLVVTVLAAAGPPAAAASPVVADDTSATTGAAAPHEQSGNLTSAVGDEDQYDEFDGVAAVDRAHAAGALETAGTVRAGDTLVVAVESERLATAYAETNASDRDSRLAGALNATNASLELLGPTPPSCERLRVDIRESRSRTLVNASSGSVRLLLDTAHLATDGGCGGAAVDGGYEVRADLPTANGTRSESTFFRFDAPEPNGDRRIGGIETRRGTASLATDLRTAADIRGAAATDRLVESALVVGGEVAVLTVRSERLASAYENASGGTPTERLRRAVNATGGRFTLTPRLEGNAQAARDQGILLSGPGVRTLPATANDTVHVVVNTGEARVREGSDTVALANATRTDFEPVLVLPGGTPERYEGRLSLTAPDADIRVARNGNGSAEGQRRLAVVGTDGRFVVRAPTNLAPGSRLTLRVRAGNRTVATRTVRAAASDREVVGARAGPGSVNATFDVGPRSAGEALTVEAHRNGTRLDRLPVLVGQPATLRDVTARRVGSESEGSRVRFAATVRYPAPGYVIVRGVDGYEGVAVPAGERVRVNGTVTVPGGDPSDDGPSRTQVRLIAVYDSNRNGEFDGPDAGPTDLPFPTAEGGVLTREADLPPPSPTPTVTAPPPGTTVAVTAAGAPGFGALAALVGVLLLVVALGRRGRSG
jgi:hypothetical protein